MKKSIKGFKLNNGVIAIKNAISPMPIKESIGFTKVLYFKEKYKVIPKMFIAIKHKLYSA
ncbi:hypothetical protein GCM10011368_06990 [Hyunsoonleella pacifica]|nr:hypothetical protein GCM10011368_06990 [Hyunsoonleella pacifica]